VLFCQEIVTLAESEHLEHLIQAKTMVCAPKNGSNLILDYLFLVWLFAFVFFLSASSDFHGTALVEA
jgi:hypothetical protein